MFGKMEDVDYIISDGNLPEEFLKLAQDANVIVL
jgi:DeoR/GlpR family transcriptional regulator of sugar metabolism